MKRPTGIAAAVFALAGLLAAAAQDRPAENPSGSAKPAQGALKTGDPAPDFKLKVLDDAEKTVSLSDFKGRKPVVLIFGSYT